MNITVSQFGDIWRLQIDIRQYGIFNATKNYFIAELWIFSRYFCYLNILFSLPNENPKIKFRFLKTEKKSEF